MAHHFGYQVVLTPSGRLMRQQFFRPRGFLPSIPARCQMMLMSGPLDFEETPKTFWTNPFSFTVGGGVCQVGIKNIAVVLPISRDPATPIASRILVRDHRYKLRPDFKVAF